MIDTIQKRLDEMLATINAATPEPWYEEGGDVRYDCSPSTIEEGHSDCTIQICEVNRVDEKLDSFKNNRTFITQSRTDWERTVKAILIAIKAFENLADLYPEFKSDTGLVLKKIEDALHGQA